MALFQPRKLPPELDVLNDLALDLFSTWSHSGDTLWEMLDAELWDRTRNPWTILQNISNDRLEFLAADRHFRGELDRLIEERRTHLKEPGWFRSAHGGDVLKQVAYFSMEFGLSEALPLYAGGLGVLAGDYLKTASDLDVPVVGVGLLYQEGYFRQFLNPLGEQEEAYPYNEPPSMPIQPVLTKGGAWMRVVINLPGRPLSLRIWRAIVGRVSLILLDSNDLRNSPVDRGITAKLYGGGQEMRFLQEIALGIGGWRALEAMELDVDICHINEGHAAFAILERIRAARQAYNLSFAEAMWATRAGNVFTTHTPVPAGFDLFNPAMIARHLPYMDGYLDALGLSLDQLLGLGRANPRDASEPFNMAYLAMRGSGTINAVSKLHAQESRRLFHQLFPRWPESEIPITHVTNGAHMPTWDSRWSDDLWTKACGKARWRGTLEQMECDIGCASDEDIWNCRMMQRSALINFARQRVARQLGQRGLSHRDIEDACQALDPNALTIGFGRRFTAYKRADLLLRDPIRLKRLLQNPTRPVQIIVAGKAHPADAAGKAMIRAWYEFVRQPDIRRHAIFLEDYDLSVALELVQGIDVWVNTPRRPLEACGTSGMKVLVNGGLHLSSLDGWWSEAYQPEFGWVIGDDKDNRHGDYDQQNVEQLYRILEQEIVPEFYDRDSYGMPRKWLERVRKSMMALAPHFSSNRMLREYVERLYLDAAGRYRNRLADNARLARELPQWETSLRGHWHEIHFRNFQAIAIDNGWRFEVHAFLGAIKPDEVAIELFAAPLPPTPLVRRQMDLRQEIPGAVHGYVYAADVATERPAAHFTPRVVPRREDLYLPAELPLIVWQR